MRQDNRIRKLTIFSLPVLTSKLSNSSLTSCFFPSNIANYSTDDGEQKLQTSYENIPQVIKVYVKIFSVVSCFDSLSLLCSLSFCCCCFFFAFNREGKAWPWHLVPCFQEKKMKTDRIQFASHTRLKRHSFFTWKEKWSASPSSSSSPTLFFRWLWMLTPIQGLISREDAGRPASMIPPLLVFFIFHYPCFCFQIKGGNERDTWIHMEYLSYTLQPSQTDRLVNLTRTNCCWGNLILSLRQLWAKLSFSLLQYENHVSNTKNSV